MSIVSAVDQDGRTFLFLRPKKYANTRPVRVECESLYLLPPYIESGFGTRVLLGVLPTEISPSAWADYIEYQAIADTYQVVSGDGWTNVFVGDQMLNGHESSSSNGGWQVIPFQDFDLALSFAVMASTGFQKHYKIPSQLPFDLSRFRDLAMAGKMRSFIPVFDITERQEPIWMYKPSLVKQLLKMSNVRVKDPRAYEKHLDYLFKAESGRPSCFKGKIPDNFARRAKVLGVEVIIEKMPEAPEKVASPHPFGIAPPGDLEQIVGGEFSHENRDWVVSWAKPPSDPHRGWTFGLKSGDLLSGMSQIAYERVVQKANTRDLIPWRRDNVSYGDCLREMILRTDLETLDMFDIEVEEETVIYEYSHGKEYAVVLIDSGDGLVVRHRSDRVSFDRTRKLKAMKKTSKKTFDKKTGHLKRMIEEKRMSDMDKLSKLKRLFGK